MKKYQLVVRIFLIIHLLSVSFCRPLVVLAGNLENTDQDDRKISFLQENQLIQTEDGKLYTTTPSNYITHSIHAALGETQTQQRNNQTIYVDPNAHISNIDIRLSNGVREYGWYGKRINNEIALCIEPGAALNLGNNSGYTVAERNTEQMKKISLIKYYGLMVSGHTLKKELMTQILAWEQQGITPLSISGVFSMTDYQTFKSAVMKNVNYFYTSPSFDKQTINLKVGESITLTDTTHAFSNYQSLPSFVSQGLSISKKGNQLTILANKNAEATSRVEFDYDIASTFQGVPLIYQHPYTQNMMVGRLNEHRKISLTINVLKNGNARVRKVDETTKQPLAGAVFRFTTSDGKTKEITTGSDGYATWNDLLVDTKVTIQEIKAPNGYVLNATPQTVTIKANETTTISLDNKEQLANLKVIKEDEETGENIPYAGAQFKIFDTWANEGEGEFVSMVRPNDTEQTEIFETNDKGEIITTESLPWGVDRYELHEIKAPEGYVPLEEPLIFSVTKENADALIRLEVPNRLARQNIQLIKRDRLNEQPIENVPFHLYNIAAYENGELTEILVEKYLTDKEGKINVEALPYGNYKFVEVEPLAGYLPLEEPMDFSVTVEKDGELLVLEAYNEREPLELTSLFTDIAGEKTLDPTVDNQLKDVVWVKGEAIEIGHTYTVFTQYKNTKTGEVVSEATSTYTPKNKEDTFEVFLELKANILKDSDQLTATHVLYYEAEQKNEVGREDDLRNKDQTITLKKEKLLLKQSILPKTNERRSLEMVLLGLSLIIIVSSYLYLQKKQKHVKL